MALQARITDALTGTVHSAGHVRIDDARILLANDLVVLTLNTYDSKAAADAGLAPVLEPQVVVLTPAEVNGLRNNFRALLYLLPSVRGLFPGAHDV